MTGSDSASGAGTPQDALNPLIDALKTAAKTAGAESPGDPKVTATFKLGWLMKELTEGWPPSPAIVGLDASTPQQYQAQAHQLSTLLGALNLDGLSASVVTALTGALQAGPATSAAVALSTQLIVALFGAGSRFPQAYALGGELRALIPVDSANAATPTPTLIAALDALSSLFPSHAARGVALSMNRWSQSRDADKPKRTVAQVDLWRSVLAGEKEGIELLEPHDYIDAATQLEKSFTRRAFRSPWLIMVAGLAAVLFVAGVAALFLVNGSAAKVAAAAAGVLSAIGLTWKGIGGTLGKLLGKLETPLWGAELDEAIADAMTLTDSETQIAAPQTLAYADRRGRAAQKGGSVVQGASANQTQLGGAGAPAGDVADARSTDATRVAPPERRL
jgi:hypothetical protein